MNNPQPTMRLIVIATVLLAVIAIGTRMFALRSMLDETTTNVSLLKIVMPVWSGQSEYHSFLDTPSIDQPQSGFQARGLAQLAAAEGDIAAVEKLLAKGMTDRSSLDLTQFELCLLYWNSGRRDLALNACRGTRASSSYWLDQGQKQNDLGNLDEALAYFQMAGYTDSGNPEAWRQLGLGLYKKGFTEQAIIALERVFALQSAPQSDVYETLGAAYLKLGNVALAREVLSRGLSAFPDDRVFYMEMADTYRVEKDFAAADSWYSRLLQRWPYDAHAWGLRGQLAEEAGHLEDAISYYEEAIANQPDGLGYWMNLAVVAHDSGDIPQATEAYMKVLEFRPNDSATLLQVGRFLVETDQIDDARRIFEQVLVLQPDNDEAAVQLAELANSTEEP